MGINNNDGEFDFIRRLSSFCETGEAGVVRGVGDDCAVYTSQGKGWEIVTTDAMVEGVHFSFDYFSPEKLGEKLASINLSDIAAMGGEPRFALVSVSSPSGISTETLLKIYKGITSVLNCYGVKIIGGNTTSSLSGLSLGMTVIGRIEEEKALFRDTAKPGDSIFVTGTMGDSAAGLEILKRGVAGRDISSAESELVKKHISPVAKLLEGRLFAESSLLTAMMDASDGLSSDIRRICEQSRTGAVILEESLPLSRELMNYKADRREEALPFALHGGEDYELLFTAPDSAIERVLSLAGKNSIPVTRIGSITEKRGGVRIKKNNGAEQSLGAGGYDHFAAFGG